MPEPPYQYLSSDAPVLDLSDLGATIGASEQKRQDAFDASRKFQKTMIEAQKDLEQNKGNVPELITGLQTSLAKAIESTTNKDKDNTGRIPRAGNLNQRVEDLCRFMAYHHFLQTGKMIPPSACCAGSPLGATDEEYLAGACMALCQDLSRYAMGRATARDVRSVQQARDLVHEILEYLMKFDFRNGFLRRKYDGTKYALKSVETLLYELSVTGASVNSDEDKASAEGEPEAKKPRLENSDGKPLPGTETQDEAATSEIPGIAEELEALRLRMEHRDGLRETLIKKCRDGQKAAKQAIYALHRKDFQRSAKLIEDCEKCIRNDLLPIVEEEPPLRYSSFGDVVEEYAEAKLFYAWLLGADDFESTKDDDKKGDHNTATQGTLLLPDQFPIALEPGVYLGGLCDLTGEIGRFAVQRGTARDYDGVRQCLEANSAIFIAVQSLEKQPNRISKKMDTLRRSFSKIERMMYEMSLSKAAGMKMNSEVSEAPAAAPGQGE